MRYEIENHWAKLKHTSKLSDIQLRESQDKIFGRIIFINEELISDKIWFSSEKIAKDIDMYDLDFIALTKHLKGYLWTGDKDLYNGLKKKNFNRVFNTTELFELRKVKQISK
jgi:predicted nucleic acid-binding protein